MNNPISDFTDELEEAGKDIAKHVVREIKDMGRMANAQIIGQEKAGKLQVKKDDDKEIDPVTGLPWVKKKATLTNLTQATAQLQLAKLKKLREELEQQRLKVSDKKAELTPIESQKNQGHGPQMAVDSSEREKDDSVSVALKGSKDTGEFKGLVGG